MMAVTNTTYEERHNPATTHYGSTKADRLIVEALREAVACDNLTEVKIILDCLENSPNKIDGIEHSYEKKAILNMVGIKFDPAWDEGKKCTEVCGEKYAYFDPEGNSILALSMSKEMVDLLVGNGASVFNHNSTFRSEYVWETMERLGAEPAAVKAVIDYHDAKSMEIFRGCEKSMPAILEFLGIMLGDGNPVSEGIHEMRRRALPGPA